MIKGNLMKYTHFSSTIPSGPPSKNRASSVRISPVHASSSSVQRKGKSTLKLWRRKSDNLQRTSKLRHWEALRTFTKALGKNQSHTLCSPLKSNSSPSSERKLGLLLEIHPSYLTDSNLVFNQVSRRNRKKR